MNDPAARLEAPSVIRVRRVESRLPWVRTYEIELGATTTAVRRGTAVRRLERALGIGDAWAFIHAADRAWDVGDRSWAVEYRRAND